jgi:branched-subunit amino acid ABC-type transport system permease component
LTLAFLVQSILIGLAAGWIYVLVSLGLTLVFGIMRIVQFALGEIYMQEGGRYEPTFIRLVYI